jgi:hypothetical protein
MSTDTHRTGCSVQRNRHCICDVLAQWDDPPFLKPALVADEQFTQKLWGAKPDEPPVLEEPPVAEGHVRIYLADGGILDMPPGILTSKEDAEALSNAFPGQPINIHVPEQHASFSLAQLRLENAQAQAELWQGRAKQLQRWNGVLSALLLAETIYIVGSIFGWTR